MVQAFPDANHDIEDIDGSYRKKYAEEHPETKKEELKEVKAPFRSTYGMEGYLVDDMKGIATDSRGQTLDDNYVVFDIETTGLSNLTCKIIEIGAVGRSGEVVDRFSGIRGPEVPIHSGSRSLQSITDDMVEDAPLIERSCPDSGHSAESSSCSS